MVFTKLFGGPFFIRLESVVMRLMTSSVVPGGIWWVEIPPNFMVRYGEFTQNMWIHTLFVPHAVC